MRKILILFVGLTTSIAQAQLEFAVIEDLVYLTDRYITPAANASVYQTSGGWYSNFRPKKLFDVELSLQYNTLLVPKSDRSFLISESDFNSIIIPGAATTAVIPTALGDDYQIELEGSVLGGTFEFTTPEGVDSEVSMHAQAQATIGLLKRTNLIIRFSPEIKINKTKYSSFGLGISHNLNQWITPLKDSSFNFGILATYASYVVGSGIDEISLDRQIGIFNVTLATIDRMDIKAEWYNVSILASKSINKFDFSTSFGVSTTEFDFELGGTGNFILDPLNEEMKTIDDSSIKFISNVNVNYKINDFSINLMLPVGFYSNFNLGINYNID